MAFTLLSDELWSEIESSEGAAQAVGRSAERAASDSASDLLSAARFPDSIGPQRDRAINPLFRRDTRKAVSFLFFRGFSNAPGRIRTCDLRIRSPLLYPTELRAQPFIKKRFIILFQTPRLRPDNRSDNRTQALSFQHDRRTRNPQVGLRRWRSPSPADHAIRAMFRGRKTNGRCAAISRRAQ